ncbi:hypothetical protein LSG31_16650 [Fodinisporobacter ferrooxydans]|uniref:DinB-like domain-containing protein n=1 Tax=Fodinisporobacter ferrooxydans TaxID=2901836 RepID=A0ABY4CG58_9BACL|nr:hypothetical protein LSG31_16650 [Alicyclobacillaceae bacterium MYW30-H2]
MIDVDRREITLFQTSIREFWNEVRQNSVTEWAFMDVEELFIGHELYHFFECSKWGFAYQESPITLPHPFFRWKKSSLSW